MSRRYTRAEQRRYRIAHGIPPIKFRKAKAKLVADRLLGKKVSPATPSFFGGSTMQSPFIYGGSIGMYSVSPKMGIMFFDMGGI